MTYPAPLPPDGDAVGGYPLWQLASRPVATHLTTEDLGNRLLRILAYVLDLIVFILLMGLPIGVIGALVPHDDSSGGTLRGVLIALLIIWTATLLFTYSPLTTALWGGTPGKQTCQLRVVSVADGRHLGYTRALGRHFAHLGLRFVPFMGFIDVLFCTWDHPLRQTLHDKAAGSMVIRRSTPFPGAVSSHLTRPMAPVAPIAPTAPVAASPYPRLYEPKGS